MGTLIRKLLDAGAQTLSQPHIHHPYLEADVLLAHALGISRSFLFSPRAFSLVLDESRQEDYFQLCADFSNF
jgi:hypothetical protein